MSGTRVTCEDIETGESETTVIENDYVVVTDGNRYVHDVRWHQGGTVVITIKRSEAAVSAEPKDAAVVPCPEETPQEANDAH